MKDKILITKIQRFSLHDGPGIRTTVFLKGYSLRCPWCANPENLNAEPEPYQKDGRDGVYGQLMSCEELFETLMKDRSFYTPSAAFGSYADMSGGVTFSGGEPLLQMDRLEFLCRKLQEEKIHMCVETALFVPKEMLFIALKYIDLFFVDIKFLNAMLCREILKGDLEQYQKNVEILFSEKKPVIFRIPVIGGFTDSDENRQEVLDWVKKYRPIKIELIKEHNLGDSKYRSLGMTPIKLNTVTDSEMERYKEEIVSNVNVEVEICKV